jgi:hypothetical protein
MQPDIVAFRSDSFGSVKELVRDIDDYQRRSQALSLEGQRRSDPRQDQPRPRCPRLAKAVVGRFLRVRRLGIAPLTVALGMGAWRMTKPAEKFSGEISIVAKSAGVCDLAERLACAQQRAAMQKARGVIQTKRMNELSAGAAPCSEQLLKVAQ